MKKIVASFQQFIIESSSDFSFEPIVRDVLLRHKQDIMVETGVSDDVFELVLNKMTSERPESLDEIDLVNDAMAHAINIQPSVQAKDEWKELASGLNGKIPQFEN